MRLLSAVLAAALLPAAATAVAQDLAIAHDPVGCVVAERLPVIEARVDPSERVADARVLFRPKGGSHWYVVRMTRGASGFRALLPRPMKTLAGFDYYLEAAGPGMSAVRTEEFSPVVAAGAAACQGRRVATAEAAGSVALEVPAGAPPVPAGFSASGVVSTAAGAAGAAAAGTAAAGAAVATAAGTTAAAAGGGGASTALLVVGGLAVAGGAAAVVATRGNDDETIITGYVYLGECTCAANRPPPYSWLTVGPLPAALISTAAGPETTTTDASGRFELRFPTPAGAPDSFEARATGPGCTTSHWTASRGDNGDAIHITLTCTNGPPPRSSCNCAS